MPGTLCAWCSKGCLFSDENPDESSGYEDLGDQSTSRDPEQRPTEEPVQEEYTDMFVEVPAPPSGTIITVARGTLESSDGYWDDAQTIFFREINGELGRVVLVNSFAIPSVKYFQMLVSYYRDTSLYSIMSLDRTFKSLYPNIETLDIEVDRRTPVVSGALSRDVVVLAVVGATTALKCLNFIKLHMVTVPVGLVSKLQEFSHLRTLLLSVDSLVFRDPLDCPNLETVILHQRRGPTQLSDAILPVDLSLLKTVRKVEVYAWRRVELAETNTNLRKLVLHGVLGVIGDVSTVQVLELVRCYGVQDLLDCAHDSIRELCVCSAETSGPVTIQAPNLKALALGDDGRGSGFVQRVITSKPIQVLFLQGVVFNGNYDTPDVLPIRAHRVLLSGTDVTHFPVLMSKLNSKDITSLAFDAPVESGDGALLAEIVATVSRQLVLFATSERVSRLPRMPLLKRFGIPDISVAQSLNRAGFSFSGMEEVGLFSLVDVDYNLVERIVRSKPTGPFGTAHNFVCSNLGVRLSLPCQSDWLSIFGRADYIDKRLKPRSSNGDEGMR